VALLSANPANLQSSSPSLECLFSRPISLPPKSARTRLILLLHLLLELGATRNSLPTPSSRAQSDSSSYLRHLILTLKASDGWSASLHSLDLTQLSTASTVEKKRRKLRVMVSSE
ncbi:hypothetical protein OTU49_008795, partial [Cherax quadricarinatus]